MVSHHWTSSISAVFNGVIFLSVPILTALAIRGWTRRWRQELPRWRSTLGLASMVVTLLNSRPGIYGGYTPHLVRLSNSGVISPNGR